MVKRYPAMSDEAEDSQVVGEFVRYSDYARLEEALRGMMEATEAVDEWKSGEAPSFLGGYAFDLVKAARTKAREVLSDAS